MNSDYTKQQVINIYKNYNYNINLISKNYTKEHLLGMFKAAYDNKTDLPPNNVNKIRLVRLIYQGLFTDREYKPEITDITKERREL